MVTCQDEGQFDIWRSNVRKAVLDSVDEFVSDRCALDLRGAGVDIAADVLVGFVGSGKCLRLAGAFPQQHSLYSSEQNIQVEVRNALQAVKTGEARLRSAAIARENTAKQYESEQRKLDNGQSDVYRVLERQTALTVAQSNELRARTELNKAIADLQHATGRSLAENGVDVVR